MDNPIYDLSPTSLESESVKYTVVMSFDSIAINRKSVLKKVCKDNHRMTIVKLKIFACLQFVVKMQITRYFVH